MIKKCIICERKHEALGFCRNHYRAFKIHGTPIPPKKIRIPKKCIYCDFISINKNMCEKHYRKFLKYGNPLEDDNRSKKLNTLDKFLHIIDSIPINENGCKIWPMGINSAGYGSYSMKDRSYNVSRLIYTSLTPGDYKGKVIRHKCDVRSCCNIDHLECGTQKDNIHDIIKRNRGLFGNNHRHCKLNIDQVLDIRRRYIKGNCFKLAKEFNVSPFTIYSIVKRVNWSHI